MSWDEAKMLSDVVTSNVVPSGTIFRALSGNGEFNVTGNGVALISIISNNSNDGGVNITVDNNDTIYYRYPDPVKTTQIALMQFDDHIAVSTQYSARALLSILLFNRKSIGGGIQSSTP